MLLESNIKLLLNLCIFAETILPLINNDKDMAIKSAQDILNHLLNTQENGKMMYNKLGLNPIKEDEHLISKLLTMMKIFTKNVLTHFQ